MSLTSAAYCCTIFTTRLKREGLSELDQSCAPFLRKVLLFFRRGDPLQTPHPTPPLKVAFPQGNRGGLEGPGRGGGCRKEEDKGEGETRRTKGHAKRGQELLGSFVTTTWPKVWPQHHAMLGQIPEADAHGGRA